MCILKPEERSITPFPIFPVPTTPSVFFHISTPDTGFSFLPARTAATIGQMFRAAHSIRLIAMSATESLFAPGVIETLTCAWAAAFKSTLS